MEKEKKAEMRGGWRRVKVEEVGREEEVRVEVGRGR